MRGRYADQFPFAAEKRPYPTTQVPQPMNAAALHGRAGQITESVQVETTVKSPEASRPEPTHRNSGAPGKKSDAHARGVQEVRPRTIRRIGAPLSNT